MMDDYYELQRTGSSWTKDAPHYAQRAFQAIDSLGDIKGKKVADVGCGDGTSTRYIVEKGADAVGYEYNHDKVAFAQNENKLKVLQYDLDKDIVSMDFTSIPRTVLYDVVFCSHTLEHTRDCVKSAENLCRMVKPGGKLLLIFPVENEFPIDNPSHTQWMTEDRIKMVKYVLETYFEKVKENRMYRFEDECWLEAEGKRC